MPEFAEQQLAALLCVLRPAPAAWVAAAREIPLLEEELEHPPEPGSPVPANDARVQERGQTRGGSDG